MFEWDERKRLVNLRKHGVDFADAVEFDWEGAMLQPDRRRDYGENRIIAVAPFRERIHVMIYTMRGSQRRLISFRVANNKEIGRYEAEKAKP